MAKIETVRARIKRFGSSWATCGVGVRPPENLVGDPRMKRLCPKLVPGQVIELPATHSLLKQRKLIEIVDEPDHDEFIRPWVFHSAEEAAMSNPSKSRLGPQQILDGLNLSEGAKSNQERKLEERREAREMDEGPDRETLFNKQHGEPDYDDEDENDRRASNRVSRKVKEEAQPVEDDDEDEDERPARRKPAAKTARKEPAPRRRRRNTDD